MDGANKGPTARSCLASSWSRYFVGSVRWTRRPGPGRLSRNERGHRVGWVRRVHPGHGRGGPRSAGRNRPRPAARSDRAYSLVAGRGDGLYALGRPGRGPFRSPRGRAGADPCPGQGIGGRPGGRRGDLGRRPDLSLRRQAGPPLGDAPGQRCGCRPASGARPRRCHRGLLGRGDGTRWAPVPGGWPALLTAARGLAGRAGPGARSRGRAPLRRHPGDARGAAGPLGSGGALVVGIDEDTAIVGRDGAWQVQGRGRVTVWRGRRRERHGAGSAVSF